MTDSKYREFLDSSSIQGANATWIEHCYEDFLDDPQSVDEGWRAFFRGVRGGNGQTEIAHSQVLARFENLARQKRAGTVASDQSWDSEAAEKQAAVLRLINYYRVRGHQAARLDPLGLTQAPTIPDLDPAFHGLSDSDLDTEFNTGSLATVDRMSLRDIIRLLKRVYTDTVGAEYMFITETAQKRWIQQRLESVAFEPRLAADEKKSVLLQLTAAEGIERYLHNRYVGQKRFSLEGGDSLIPMLDEAMRRCAQAKVEEMVVGMAHRGRLNVLVNVLGKSPSDLFAEFEGKVSEDFEDKAGDVKYHMGFSTDVEISGERLHLVLAFNPSHLEIANPVVEGSVKARQTRRHDERGERVLPLLIHGDAAFAGQGVVMETLQLSYSKGYSTGGTVHIIVNNQIGFTTPNPIEARPYHEARSSRYCTDLAKMLEAPVFHVNGDDPEAVIFVTRLAMDFRREFHKDVIIDLCCYRRHGHNEADEPAVTQPAMYQAIKKQPTTLTLYRKQLVDEGVVSDDEAEQLMQAYRDGLDRGENTARTTLGMVGNKHTVNWSHYQSSDWRVEADTSMSMDTMRGLADKLLALPDDFELNARVKRIMSDRRKMIDGESPLDWGFAETMAYAGLVNDGFAVRLCGQDSRRGTFFHRHATIHDAKTGRDLTPLRHLSEDKNQFIAIDTLLSEEGVLGFEYGYSTADPQALVIWEAQFGDFGNGAQVVIDQFIAAGEAKWGRFCGLTMFLPHGYEGQGPEHSSARLERYLQLCAQNNMQVCVPSTPAQMFHMLRRQMKRSLRTPLIVLTPKSLLRHKQSVSSLDDLAKGQFQCIIDDPADLEAKAVKRIVFCSGKVFYDLLAARDEAEQTDVALIRVEQLYPFPLEEYEAIIKRYSKAKDIVWCQEEPENQGAWYQIKHRLQVPLTSGHTMRYATRPGSPSTAVGYLRVHQEEQKAVVDAALNGGKTI